MDIIVNFSVRRDGQPAMTAETILVRDVIVKSKEEVVEEITDQIENAVDMCFEDAELNDDE